VTGRGENGCLSDLVKHSAAFYQTRAFAGRDTVAAENQPVQLNGTGGTYYVWSPAGGLSDPARPDPVATNNRQATYVLTAYSPAGCETTDSITIKIYKGPELYMPTAFSPNGDGRNERYRFIAVGMRSLQYFHIFNRLGQQVYSSTRTEGWDGTINGIKQPAGNYTWTISGTDYNGKQYLKKGSFILIR
jgi:gliding motility-associated-like protein